MSHAACSSSRILVAASRCSCTFFCCACNSSISAFSFAISALRPTTLSVISSIAREASTALRVSDILSDSQLSLISRSLFSSDFSKAIILSIASMTGVKRDLAESGLAKLFARAIKRASPDLRAASSSAAAAPLAAFCTVIIEICRKPCEEKDLLNKSRASSLCKMEIALVIAASSALRSSERTFHSSFLVFKEASVSSMNFLSFAICVFKESTSSVHSCLDIPRAPFSSSIFERASLEASSWPFFAPLNFSYWAFASASFVRASSKFVSKVVCIFCKTSWIFKDRAL
mmetsp:Transcript_53071/g.84413  ORF Transcript_53071/g.84413 Transcript_53071/m.84413 type:complete len:288 (-) Transcript_53071:726-1589(-)